ncbi:MAG: mevalonate kinase, partial [Thermoprotei archaeon]
GGGGNIVALTWKEDGGKVADALRKISRKVYVCDVSAEGVRIEG